MRFPMRMRFARESRESIEELERLIVPIPTPSSGRGASAGMSSGASSGAGAGMSAGASGGAGMGGGMNSATPVRDVSNSAGAGDAASSSSLLSSGQTSGQTFVPLAYLADIRVVSGPSMINSEHGSLRAVVFMNARGRDMGGVVEDAQKAITERLKLPAGYSVEWSGQYEHKIRADRTIKIIMPVVFVLIFVLLYFTLHDYVEAGVVMLSVPFALIGGMYMIYALGYNFSIAVWVGFIALYGVAVETGVVMVVYLHEALDKRLLAVQRGERGELTAEDIHEAAVDGSVLRLRPKLMTVLTAMIGLVPVMWATGTGADVMKPLTAPMIGGLLTSAVHVLVVTPVLFVIMKEHALKKGTLKVSKMAGWMSH
jgi:Cu(I)/Ag(I) efflux system membrane protein CusA/SilA